MKSIMARQLVSHWCLTLLFLAGRWEKETLCEATGVPLDLMEDYIEERRGLTRERLEAIVASLRLTSDDVRELFSKMPRIERKGRMRSWEEYQAEVERIGERWARGLGRQLVASLALPEIDLDYPGVVALRRTIRATRDSWGKLFTELLILIGEDWEALWRPREEERAQGAELWARLEPFWRKNRYIGLLEAGSDVRRWPLFVHLCSVCVDTAPRDAAEAVELMELAFDASRACIRGPAGWRNTVEAYLWAHMAYARRCAGELEEARDTLGRARSLLREASAFDPDLMEGNNILDTPRFPW